MCVCIFYQEDNQLLSEQIKIKIKIKLNFCLMYYLIIDDKIIMYHPDIFIVFSIHLSLHIQIFHFNIYFRFLVYFCIPKQDFLLKRDVCKLNVSCNILFS